MHYYEAEHYFESVVNSYGRKIDYDLQTADKLRKQIKVGKSYKASEKEAALEAFAVAATRIDRKGTTNINDANLSGPRSELNRAIYRAKCAKDLKEMEAALKKMNKNNN